MVRRLQCLTVPRRSHPGGVWCRVVEDCIELTMRWISRSERPLPSFQSLRAVSVTTSRPLTASERTKSWIEKVVSHRRRQPRQWWLNLACKATITKSARSRSKSRTRPYSSICCRWRKICRWSSLRSAARKVPMLATWQVRSARLSRRTWFAPSITPPWIVSETSKRLTKRIRDFSTNWRTSKSTFSYFNIFSNLNLF